MLTSNHTAGLTRGIMVMGVGMFGALYAVSGKYTKCIKYTYGTNGMNEASKALLMLLAPSCLTRVTHILYRTEPLSTVEIRTGAK